MREKQPFPDHLLINCLNIAYGIDVTRLIFLPMGADMNASVYKAEAQDHASYFVKLKRGFYPSIGSVLAELLHDAGIEQIIPPIKTVQGQPTQRIEDFTVIVYPFVKGQDGFSCNLTDHQWIKLGKALKQVHKMNVPLSIQTQIRQEVYSPKWRETVRSFYSHLEVDPIGDEITLKLWKFMNQNILAIRRLVDCAEKLGQEIQSQSPKFVLYHSDIHSGNVLIDGNETIYIVDWDDPIMAPKERDLMFIGGGVGNVWNKSLEEKLFYQGYGKTDVDLTILAYYRHERIVEDIALLGQQLLLSTAGGKDRPEIYKQFVGMFERQGVVDIAFKTNKNLAL